MNYDQPVRMLKKDLAALYAVTLTIATQQAAVRAG